ncbi:thymidylate synthase, flavin-dependent [Lachnospiraceae bacterium 3-1]|nr:thymidylate synthase, flavin-dependent [Lachnospiraceae bacterium 3-1]
MVKSSAKILFYNDNSDSIVAAAGRISTTKGSAIEIYEKSCEKDITENIALIQKIMSSGHTSVLEHVFLNLAFEHVSVFVEQFIIEFRLASFTVKSRRYVDFGNMGYVMPEFGGEKEKSGKMRKLYEKHMDFLFAEYHNLLEQGIPKEDARFVLPYSFRSNFYCTVNAREFLKIVNEMVWGRGKEYPEIAALGESLRKQCEERMPFLKFGCSVEQEKSGRIKSLFSKEKEGSSWIDDSLAGIPSEFKHKDANENLVDLWNTSTDTPEEIICRAAMLEAGMEHWQEIEVKEPRLQKEVIREVLSHGRKRELEQVNVTAFFRGISLAGVTHLARHRMQSIVVPKYIEICSFDSYIVPKTIEKAGLKVKYENVFFETKRVAEQLKEMGMQDQDMIYLLLSGLKVPVLTTMNANELFTFLRLRTCQRAQWEIADHARELLWILRKKHPVLFSLYGPSCYVTGECPEGKMSCGQKGKVRDFYTMGE